MSTEETRSEEKVISSDYQKQLPIDNSKEETKSDTSIINLYKNSGLTMQNFDKIQFIGRGSYSKVVLARHKTTGKLCAMKIIQRKLLEKEKKEYEFKIEYDVLTTTNHPNIIKLLYTFTNEKKIYFGLEYAPNGELTTLLRVANTLPYPLAQYYAAEIVSALEYLHSHHIAHRDLKPENILLDENYRLKITDFGTSKFVNKKSPAVELTKDTKVTFVGTPEYVAPEVLLDSESGMASDLWALGCIIYKFFTGKAPFSGKSDFKLYESIIRNDFDCPPNMPVKAINLCKKLLVKEPSKRLGTGPINSPLGYEMLKKDEFFEGIDFVKLEEIRPPIDAELLAKLKAANKKKTMDERVIGKVDEIMEREKSGESKVLKEGVVKKKCGWIFYKKRKLILTARPRLYYGLTDGEYKGDILLTMNVRADKLNDVKFDVITPKRVYKFEGETVQDAEEWVDIINKTIKNYCY